MTTGDRWTADELARIDAAGEVDVATRRQDGTLRTARVVWIVRRDDAVYVRSVNGPTAAWYRGVRSRHEGELTAGRLHRDVVFVEAGERAGDGDLDDDLDGDLDGDLDDAYRDKYGRSSSAVARITADVARTTTLRLDPA